MSGSYLEIVELEDGSYALQRMDGDEGPLVVISFSEQVADFLQDNQAAVAKAMMGAGVQAASAASRAEVEKEEQAYSERTLH